MKIAVVYNRDSKSVINVFGSPNQEKIGLKTIKRILDALKKGGHQAVSIEGDKDLVDKLEEFMPRVVKGENPGLVFNVSYGIQGQARYTHVPGILEMVGVPYVGSGPLAHSLALDKVVSKAIFKQNGVPTADFVVLTNPEFEAPELPYPLIVKPKNEAVSFGIKVVHNEAELREASQVIFDKFDQPVLAEQYIEGREVNVGLLGNNPPEALPPAEIVFGMDGPRVYTYEDKTGKSGRDVHVQCPADLTPALREKAHSIARHAFTSLGCYDCARVDMRLDKDNNFFVLEINSLPSMGEHGSYTHAAEAAGLDYAGLVNRLVEVASARYFGTPAPPDINLNEKDLNKQALSFLTSRRDRIEKRVQEWTMLSSRTSDPVGLLEVRKRFDGRLEKLGMNLAKEWSDDRSVHTWQTKKGLSGGTLLIGHLDVPLGVEVPAQPFRRDPECLYGEGIGCSRAPLVMMEFTLQTLRNLRKLHNQRLGVLFYQDEGRDARYSCEYIAKAAKQASRVLVLRPGTAGDHVVTQRRGERRYILSVEGKPQRLGRATKAPQPLIWLCAKLEAIQKLTHKKSFLAVSATDLKTTNYPMLLPHRVVSTLRMSYLETKIADETLARIQEMLGKGGPKWSLECISDRPPMKDRNANQRLMKSIQSVAQKWEIPMNGESSVWPTVAGLVAGKTGVLCGVGPVAQDLFTPQESVQRISLIQRTLLLTQFLLAESEKS